MAKIKRIKTIFQIRRDTSDNWELNKGTIPEAGEPCYDLTLKTLRIGDGISTYENLPIVGEEDTRALLAEMEAVKATLESLQSDVDNIEEDISDVQEQVGETNLIEMEENVTNLTTQMETAQTQITNVKETLETKVDAEAVAKLETNLKTYVDEQIKLVETTSIDDGEI